MDADGMHRGLFGNCRSGKNSFDENVDEKGEMISDKGGTRLTYLFFFCTNLKFILVIRYFYLNSIVIWKKKRRTRIFTNQCWS